MERHLLCPDRGSRRRDRFSGRHLRQGPSLGGGRKRGAFTQAIGASRGGRTTKLHALVDERGRPRALIVTAGNTHELTGLAELLRRVRPTRRLLADRAYDANKLRAWLAERGVEAVIPPNPTRKHPHPWDPQAYRARNLVERMFCRLKDFRRVATRYDKRSDTYLSGVLIAAALTWWTAIESGA